MKKIELKKVFFHPYEDEDDLGEKAKFLKENKDYVPWLIGR